MRTYNLDQLNIVPEDNIEYYYTMYMHMIHMDADGDDDSASNGGSMFKIPYGLCANEGIETEGMTPTEAWQAYQEKTGIGHDDVLKTLKDKTKAAEKKEKSLKKSISNYSKKLEGKTKPDGDLKSLKKQLHTSKVAAEHAKMNADWYAAKAAEYGDYEQFMKDHPYWNNYTEEMAAKSAESYAKEAAAYKQKYEKYSEDVAELETKVEELAEWTKVEKTIAKKQSELESIKNGTIHVSEETAQKGAQAKSEYLAKKKAEWKGKLDDKFEAVKNSNNTSYKGIWKDKTVKPSDYAELKDSIQGKKEYFEGVLSSESSTTANKEWATAKLGQLAEFEEKGKQYLAASKEFAKVQAAASKWGLKSASQIEYASKAVPWKTAEEYDKEMREHAGAVWNNATGGEKLSAFTYTESFSQFNESLRGIKYGTSQYVGPENIDWQNIGVDSMHKMPGEVKGYITKLTSMIDKTSSPVDAWLQRGVYYDGAEKFLNMSGLSNKSNDELQALVGTTPKELAFCSTAGAKGKGYSSCPVIFNIFAPSGTKMLYAEPFSHYGNGAGKSWDGVSNQYSFGSEFETIIQQGTSFQITKAERPGGSYGTIYIDMMVVDQSPRYL